MSRWGVLATCLKTCGLGEMIKSLVSYMAWLGMCAARKDAVTVLRLALGVSACCLDGFEAGIRTSDADWIDKLGCADVGRKRALWLAKGTSYDRAFRASRALCSSHPPTATGLLQVHR